MSVTPPTDSDLEVFARIATTAPAIAELVANFAQREHLPGLAYGVVAAGRLVYGGGGLRLMGEATGFPGRHGPQHDHGKREQQRGSPFTVEGSQRKRVPRHQQWHGERGGEEAEGNG